MKAILILSLIASVGSFSQAFAANKEDAKIEAQEACCAKHLQPRVGQIRSAQETDRTIDELVAKLKEEDSKGSKATK